MKYFAVITKMICLSGSYVSDVNDKKKYIYIEFNSDFEEEWIENDAQIFHYMWRWNFFLHFDVSLKKTSRVLRNFWSYLYTKVRSDCFTFIFSRREVNGYSFASAQISRSKMR